MSTKQYRTCSHACQALDYQFTPISKAAGLRRTNSESSISTIFTLPGEGTPRAASPVNSVNTPICLYSDVVLTRIPLMPGVLEATPMGISKAETVKGDGSVSQEGKPKVTFDLHTELDISSEEKTDESGDDQPGNWTTVQKKRG